MRARRASPAGCLGADLTTLFPDGPLASDRAHQLIRSRREEQRYSDAGPPVVCTVLFRRVFSVGICWAIAPIWRTVAAKSERGRECGVPVGNPGNRRLVETAECVLFRPRGSHHHNLSWHRRRTKTAILILKQGRSVANSLLVHEVFSHDNSTQQKLGDTWSML